MNGSTRWICIGWENRPVECSESSITAPAPVEKRVTCPDRLNKKQVLAAFRRKFPQLRNHTVHREDDPAFQAVLHHGPDQFPTAVEVPLPQPDQSLVS